MPEFPSGTVTFLFTDIEGSTALWERDRAAMVAAVERHLQLLRSAITAHGGVLYKLVGDAVQAAFATAPAAVAAALDAQRALLAEPWDSAAPLRVRMALHAGEAEPRDGDYLTAPLNRLSRLLVTGHGGQVLLTQSVQQLCRGALPQAVALRDLGEHRLRDLLEPERIFQLLHPDLPADFPPLRTLAERPITLPVPATPFLGREQEVAQITALVRREGVRLVTLTGPGGVGKTRLALQLAAEVADAFPAGVWFVGLAPITNPDLVVSTIAEALGVREAGGEPLSVRLRSFLRDKRLLLVLDNFEQVVETAPLIADVLAAAPDLKVVVTSRVRLRLSGEYEHVVPPLEVVSGNGLSIEKASRSEAVRLFVARAQAVRENFALTEENAAAVSAICRRLDGLPLAIELAAARVKILPPAALLARLEKRLPLLTGGSRDLPARQQTMRDAISWSYDLLTPQEQALFRCLAVFAGGFAWEAVEVVCGNGDIDPLEGVASLVDKSLVREDGPREEPRYRMLETVREFGLEQLAASGEEAALRQAHAAYFLRLAEQGKPYLYGAGQRAWLRRLEVEHPNFRAALETLATSGDHEAHLRLAANLGLFWFLHAHFAEGRAQLERALARAVSPSSERAEALLGIGRIAGCQSDWVAAESWLRQSEELARGLDVPVVLWQALFERGRVAKGEGDEDRAVLLWESALAVARELNDPQAASVQLLHLSDAAYRRGDLEAAERLGEEAVAVVRPVGDEFVLSIALGNIGQVALAHGDGPRALLAYQEALDLGRGIGNDWAIANALAGFAAVAAAQDEHLAAARLLGATETFRAASHMDVVANAAHHAQTTQAVRAALGEAAFAEAWDAGRALSAEEAVELPCVLELIMESGPLCGPQGSQQS
jgi:predicted ATPase/class 3 adenylate cyclase